MTKALLIWPALGLLAAGCAQTPPPAAPAPAPTNQASAAPASLEAPASAPAVDPVTFALAQADLRALGYAVGKSTGMADPAFQHALTQFQKDQGLATDGQLSDAVMDRLKLARATLTRNMAQETARDAVFVYGDGVSSRQAIGFSPPPPQGLASDAPAKFLQPLHPGSQGSYHLGHRAADGSVAADVTVTCHAGRPSQSELPIGALETIPVDCDAAGTAQWHALFSPKLGVVVRQQSVAGIHELTAIRPFTASWPSAARTGLDWALTHALDVPIANQPVQWSSTGVTPQFEIKASAALSGQQAGLSGKFAALFCRRFELAQIHSPASYPGIACQDKSGAWMIPGSNAALASPGSGIGGRAPLQRNARN